jgi:hypothetical protein
VPRAIRATRGPAGCGLRMCSQTTLVRRPATSGRCVRSISARGTARRRRPRTDHPFGRSTDGKTGEQVVAQIGGTARVTRWPSSYRL